MAMCRVGIREGSRQFEGMGKRPAEQQEKCQYNGDMIRPSHFQAGGVAHRRFLYKRATRGTHGQLWSIAEASIL